MRKPHAGIIGALVASITVILTSAEPGANVDAAFRKFWDAKTTGEAVRAVAEVVKSGVTLDEAYQRLKAGRSYSADVPKGVVRKSRRQDGFEFFYDLNVPVDYDPARKYQVRFQLHGGIGGRQSNEPRGDGSIGALAGAEQIYIIPYGWNDAPWWGEAQLTNFPAILDSVKRAYNVDENRVAMAGVSDGATGLYYFAMRDTTPYASFLPLNGFLMVLANSDIGVSSELFPGNLLNKPFFAVNGSADPLYPTNIVEPYLQHLERSGVSLEYHPQPNAGHNTRWWPEVKDTFEKFVREHPRTPLPDRLSWETIGGEHADRAHWLVVNRVRSDKSPSTMPDANKFKLVSRNIDLFAHPKPSGRVDLVRHGNTVETTTHGVAEFTLLLSPDQFDFSKPVTVTANGKTVFDGKVTPSVDTLMKWAARDNDRTMLFGAELVIKIP